MRTFLGRGTNEWPTRRSEWAEPRPSGSGSASAAGPTARSRARLRSARGSCGVDAIPASGARDRLIPRQPGYPAEVLIGTGEPGQAVGLHDRHDQGIVAEEPSRGRCNRDLILLYADGVAQPSPGSPKAHPWSRSPHPKRTPTGFHKAWQHCGTPLGFGRCPAAAFPGCAARPWAVMCNAFGVSEASTNGGQRGQPPNRTATGPGIPRALDGSAQEADALI
jgi:hypothetical protein